MVGIKVAFLVSEPFAKEESAPAMPEKPVSFVTETGTNAKRGASSRGCSGSDVLSTVYEY